uniref:Secreted protein n=1 Tax=Mesocestoides corti TaxID=53468 RepID=A0A5K3F1U9_MESCO
MQIAFPVAAMNSSIAMAQAEESPSHRTAPPAATRRAPSAAPVASHANHLCLSVWVCLFRWGQSENAFTGYQNSDSAGERATRRNALRWF